MMSAQCPLSTDHCRTSAAQYLTLRARMRPEQMQQDVDSRLPTRISLYEIRVACRLLCRLRRLVRRGDIGADHARFEFVNGHNVGCREREYSQCGPMDIGRRQCALTDVRIIECSRRI